MSLLRWGLCLSYAGCCITLFYCAYFAISPAQVSLEIFPAQYTSDLLHEMSQSIKSSKGTSAESVYHILSEIFPVVTSVAMAQLPDRTAKVTVMLEPIIARINDSKLLCGNTIVDDQFFQSEMLDNSLAIRASSFFLSRTRAATVLSHLIQKIDPVVYSRYSIFIEHELSAYLTSIDNPGLIIHSTIDAFPAPLFCTLCERIFNELNLSGSFKRSHINLMFDMRFSGGLVISQVEGG